MKKILLFLLSTLVIFSPTATIIACNNDIKTEKYIDPDWIAKMPLKSGTELSVGYNGYYLSSAKSNFQQTNWLNLEQENHIYLYLANIISLDEAMTKLSFGDTADMSLTTNILEPITFTKHNNAYLSNSFLTQNTTVGGYTMMAQEKWADIKESKNMKQLNEKFQNEFNQSGTIKDRHPIQEVNGQKFVWWNSNRWEILLQTDIQKAIYKVWSSTENDFQVGMNIPLSIVSAGAISVSATNTPSVFRIDLNYQEDWINNSFKKIKYVLPHWGFYFNVKTNTNNFISSQLIAGVSKTFSSNNVLTYLEQKQFFSFNATGYKNAEKII